MLKRVFDILFAAPIFLISLPLMLVLALLIRVRLGSPVLFRQKRAGFAGRVFVLVKFRSMTDARDASGQLLPDHIRLTTFGQFLRKTSLDELPTLWNVLKGDVSLIGPRPLHVAYLPRYSARQARRHEVKPGITGWAQVNGRNAISWSEKFELDVWYVDNRGFKLDMLILYLTLVKVLGQSDISSDNAATMDEFLGNSDK